MGRVLCPNDGNGPITHPSILDLGEISNEVLTIGLIITIMQDVWDRNDLLATILVVPHASEGACYSRARVTV